MILPHVYICYKLVIMENPDEHVFFSKCLLMRNDRILQYCIITFFQLINDRSPVSTDVSRAYFAAWPKAQSTVVSASFAPQASSLHVSNTLLVVSSSSAETLMRG
jgi:hypothetical protein